MNINDSLVLLKFKPENEIHVYQELLEGDDFALVPKLEQVVIPVSSIKHAEGLLALILELKQLQEMSSTETPAIDPSKLSSLSALLSDKLSPQPLTIYEKIIDEYFYLISENLLSFPHRVTKLIPAPLPIKKVELIFDGKIYSASDYKQTAVNAKARVGLIHKKLKQLNVQLPERGF